MPNPVPYERADGSTTWRVRMRAHGRFTSETFHTEAEARKFCQVVAAIGPEAAIRERGRRDTASEAHVPTVAQWLDRHIRDLTGVTDRTRADYRSLAQRTFLPIVGRLPIDTVDRSTVAKVVNTLERQAVAGGDRTLSAKTIANAHGLLSSLMRTAVLEKLIPGNPCTGVRLPRSGEEDRRDGRYLTHAEWDRLYAALPHYWRPLAITLVGTGLRWSEATALQVGDIDPAAGTIRVVRSWKRTPGQGMKPGPPKTKKARRTLLFGGPVRDALLPLVLDREPTALVFTSPQGGPVHSGNFRSRVWVPAVRRAGLTDVRIHDLRHTHVSWLIELGISLEAIQDQVGHESILTTRAVYGHLQPAMREQLAEAATRMLSAPAALPARPATPEGLSSSA